MRSTKSLTALSMSDILQFGVKVNELKDLMQTKGHETREKLQDFYNGTEGLCIKLNTSVTGGLVEDTADLQKRAKTFGKNNIPPKPPKSIFSLIFEALQDTTIVMLIICSFVSIGLSFYNPEAAHPDEDVRTKAASEVNLEWVEGVAILVAVMLVVLVTAVNDWKKERQFRSLKDKIEQEQLASVIRNGQVKQVNVKDLVVGDICFVKYGDLIPADGIVVQASDLQVDESSLTGETDLIKKDDTENLTLLSGTHVMEGSGKFLVLAVGLNSQTGIIMSLLGATDEDEETENEIPEEISDEKKKTTRSPTHKVGPEPDTTSITDDNKTIIKPNKPPVKKSQKKTQSILQLKLGKLALKISYIGMVAAAFTFIILCVRMFIEELAVKKNPWTNVYFKYILSYLVQAITVIVVAVPEGLPLAVALALSFAVRRMTKDNNLVRHLDACETMGNATTICSDKTGTLTTNRMTVVECWLADKFYERVPTGNELSQEYKTFISESISINTNYSSIIESAKNEGELPKQIGNKTECGLLGFVLQIGEDYDQMRSTYPNDSFVKVYTFNSARKMMTTIVQNKTTNGYRLYSKGASEMVLSKCSHYLDSSCRPVKISNDKYRDLIVNVVEKMAMNGLRTICVAYRDFPTENGNGNQLIDWDDEQNVIADLTCVCLVGIEDPVRPEVPDAIRKCQQSGVTVRMVTGDNVKTATSIALKCGIVKPNDDFLILESKEFNRKIRDKETGEIKQELLDKVWPRLRVLARSSPQDKYNLVNGIVESKISSNREVVAVTGDGTNDGPALKRADVGFAMGIQGTDVAKEASDIILTDDNFTSIVKAMMWGRNVYDAIAKFLQFQLTANFVAIIISVVCAALIKSVPLKAVQMLWVNLVMDTLASLALATELPTEDLLKRAPYGRDKPIISITMMKNIIGMTFYKCVMIFALVFAIENWMDVDSVIKYDDMNKLKEPSVHFTIIFNAFVVMTLFNEVFSRKINNEKNCFEGILKNYMFMVIWLICFSGQILIVCFGGIVVNVKMIDLDHWMWCLLLGFGLLLWGQILSLIKEAHIRKIIDIACFFSKDKGLLAENLEMQKHKKIKEGTEEWHSKRAQYHSEKANFHSQKVQLHVTKAEKHLKRVLDYQINTKSIKRN